MLVFGGVIWNRNWKGGGLKCEDEMFIVGGHIFQVPMVVFCSEGLSHTAVLHVTLEISLKSRYIYYTIASSCCNNIPKFDFSDIQRCLISSCTPLKFNSSPLKKTIFIGNTSSNHWFSGVISLLNFQGVYVCLLTRRVARRMHHCFNGQTLRPSALAWRDWVDSCFPYVYHQNQPSM